MTNSQTPSNTEDLDRPIFIRLKNQPVKLDDNAKKASVMGSFQHLKSRLLRFLGRILSSVK
jgi:hypothetical protein